MTTTRLLPLVAFAALFTAGCSMPLPQTEEYTYWQRKPGDSLYVRYTSDHQLSKAEQEELKIVAEGEKPPAPTPETNW